MKILNSSLYLQNCDATKYALANQCFIGSFTMCIIFFTYNMGPNFEQGQPHTKFPGGNKYDMHGNCWSIL